MFEHRSSCSPESSHTCMQEQDGLHYDHDGSASILSPAETYLENKLDFQDGLLVHTPGFGLSATTTDSLAVAAASTRTSLASIHDASYGTLYNILPFPFGEMGSIASG
eukprot:scpid17765/ scgid10069/ 